jgi:diguanylate cyclase (GGDEF)-like protein
MLGHGDEQQALVICCLAMGAVTVTFPAAVFPRAFDVFQVPILGAFAVGLAVSDLEHAVVLSIASAMLAAAMAIIGHEIGGQLVLAIRLSQENARLARRLEERGAALEAANAELEIQSLTDPLTGAANRRRLMSFLRSAPRRCAILVVDVDHFKSYNDSFGHADGDVCLVLVAGALRDCIRPQVDLVARQGGEEFAVVLTDVCDDEAMSIAERIRVAVEALSTAQPRQIRRLVTVSIGVAWRSPKQRKTLDSLMAEADAALYEAKRSGRNRVCAGLSGNRAVA